MTAIGVVVAAALPVYAYATLATDATSDGVGLPAVGFGAVPLALLAAAVVLLVREYRRTIRQRDRLREMQGTARIGSWRWDVKADRFSAGSELLRIFGLPRGRGGIPLAMVLDRVHRDDRARVSGSFARAADGRTPLAERCRVIAASGEVFVVEMRAVGEPDRRGCWRALRGTVQDITELSRSEEQRAQLLAQVDSVDEAIVGTTLEGMVTEWNAGAERLFGYTRSEMLGRDVRILRPPEKRNGSGLMLASIRAGRRMDRQELDRLRKDGTRVDVAISGTPVWSADNEIVAATFTYWDIARQKRLENELAERVSH
ncbi:MAG: PAS domain S-box protein, partial [Chloroflexi bacterium]|nr:PAS domain S-box protein [Chloroflexota bacterium]